MQMKPMRFRRLAAMFGVLLLTQIPVTFAQQSTRFSKDLSANNWKLWLDENAEWVNDELYPPPVDLSKLPVNPPTGGWNALEQAKGMIVHLPATVEQYYWGRSGNPFGVSGDYLGVSWFTTRVDVPASLKNKRVTLQFESVRFRAEVFVNRRLVGYDIVNSTPFEVDISHAVRYGQGNEIAVRITDPNGNFDWRDSQNFMWGNYRTIPSHGFGGITGRVKLVATDRAFISDVYIKNKPTVNEVDIEVTLSNMLSSPANGTLLLVVKEARGERRKVFEQRYPIHLLVTGNHTQSFTIGLDNPRLWSVDEPNLYELGASWKGDDRSGDAYTQRFGFRWFEVRDVGGDKQFYLNGKRIVLRTAISWGFWPVSGIAPTDALAKKQIAAAKKLGLNMLNFHRTIGAQNVLDYADELGLLYFEEPGGNQYPADRFASTDSIGRVQRDFYFTVRNEKLFRMIKRDRSHPSLIIYNMHNERGALPQEQDRQQMLAAHRLDEGRILTYNSCNGDIKIGPDPKFKLHLLPYDTTFYDYGWFDQHHAGGPGTYHDNLYNGPREYLRYTDHKDEIIYWGEEGAIGTPPRLQLIRNEILKAGKQIGWESDAYLKWYDAYANFLKQDGFKEAYPSVDALTIAMGNVAYYYQGRAIENIRINNIADGYAVNGWESMMLENHSGIVDNYRNFKGDVDLIARYSEPVYLAVKMNRKVLSVGDTSTIDFHLVNEVNLSGDYTLAVNVIDPDGKTLLTKSIAVNVKGGVQYGEMLHAAFPVVARSPGYAKVTAQLQRGGKTYASGEDAMYAVQLDRSGIPTGGMVADTSGVVAQFLKSVGVESFKEFKSGRPEGDYLLVGAFEPQQTGNPLVTDILEWVNEGHTLIIVNNIERWADHLAQKEVIDYRGAKVLGKSWYGGNYFSKKHALFNGLPQASVFNWEYQCFAAYNKNRVGLRLFNGETVVACVSDHKKEVYSALSIIPHGRGKIIMCALDMFSCIKDVKPEKKSEGEGENAALASLNTSQRNKANVVGWQLLLNMLRYAGTDKSH